MNDEPARNDAAFVEVRGNVYEARDALKALGGHWDAAAKCWRVPSHRRLDAERIAAECQAGAREAAERRWMEYARGLAWGKGSLAESCFNAGLRAASLGVDFETAVREVFALRQQGGGTTPESQTRREVRRAYDHAGSLADTRGAGAAEVVAPVKKRVFEPPTLRRFAGSLAGCMSSEWLWRRSPVDVRACSADDALRRLFLPGERVVVFDVFASQGQWVWGFDEGFAPSVIDHGRWCRTRAGAPPMKAGRAFDGRGENGIWFLANPVTGAMTKQDGLDDRGRGRWSRRSEDAVMRWRYMVLESDEADKREWCAALAQLRLPVAAIYESGGKSIHVLIRVDAETKEQFDAFRNQARAMLVPLGADPAAMSAVRLSRLPCCWRGGNEQRLLWLCEYGDVESREIVAKGVVR
jgi:hypothetical protein